MIKLIAVFLLCCAAYIATFAFRSHSVVEFLLVLWATATAIGLWLHKQWSQCLVYAISLALVVFSLAQVRALLELGWPYEDPVRSFVSASILCVPLVFAVGIGVHVFRVFRRKS
jgi:hypothetical protein